MLIDSRYAVIGHPIEHSLSPGIHNEVFGKLSLPAVYNKIAVKPSELADFCLAMKSGNVNFPDNLGGSATPNILSGINVTIPHKEEIVRYLDVLHGDAKHSGSVNTVVCLRSQEAKLGICGKTVPGYTLVGSNTDMGGLLLAIRKLGFEYRDSRIAVLGSGGAAAGVICKAAMEGAKSIDIIARNAEKAEIIKRKARSAAEASGFSEVSISLRKFSDSLGDSSFDILINATPLGMASKDDFQTFSFLDYMAQNALVYDLVYNNSEDTNLICAAKATGKGLVTATGLSMLVFQALLSDMIFLGGKFPDNRLYEMYEYIIAKLRQGELI